MRADAIRERDFRVRLPPVSRAAIRGFAGNGGVQAAKRADWLDIIVRAKRQRHAVFQHGGPGVSADDALSPDAVLGPAHVRGLMRGLHGSNDVELRKAGQIYGGADLCALDAAPPLPPPAASLYPSPPFHT